jgi:hypothetical protein
MEAKKQVRLLHGSVEAGKEYARNIKRSIRDQWDTGRN